ncbi:MAG: hypothetical protein IPG18_02345 [Saprospiraceae bacterium]|nr:hypothetical protein [Saprospiraceae bacterium]
MTVLGATTPVLDGPSSICIGSTTQFLPNTGGTWSSSNTMVGHYFFFRTCYSNSSGKCSFFLYRCHYRMYFKSFINHYGIS